MSTTREPLTITPCAPDQVHPFAQYAPGQHGNGRRSVNNGLNVQEVVGRRLRANPDVVGYQHFPRERLHGGPSGEFYVVDYDPTDGSVRVARTKDARPFEHSAWLALGWFVEAPEEETPTPGESDQGEGWAEIRDRLRRQIEAVTAERDTYQQRAYNLQSALDAERTGRQAAEAKIEEITDALIEAANSRGWCDEYDEFAARLGLRARARMFSAEVSVTYVLSIEVEAADQEDAEAKVRDSVNFGTHDQRIREVVTRETPEEIEVEVSSS